jgi:Sulfotransferase family
VGVLRTHLSTGLRRKVISYKHKFIFIHIYKNAGSSIRSALLPHIRTPIQRGIGRLGQIFGHQSYDIDPIGSHATAKSYVEFLGVEEYRTYLTFAIVRNPWDWQVSLYSFMKNNKEHPQHTMVAGMSFEQYVEWRCAAEPYSQKRFLADSEGRLIVKFVGKYENINADFAKICKMIGISSVLPHINMSNHAPYRDYYKETTKRKIAQAFAGDIDCFAYHF